MDKNIERKRVIMKKNNKKLIILITVIILIGIIIGSVVIRRFVVKQETQSEKYLIGENTNSNLIANNIKKGITIGGNHRNTRKFRYV